MYINSIIQGKGGATKVKMFVDTGSTSSLLLQALVDDLGIILVTRLKGRPCTMESQNIEK